MLEIRGWNDERVQVSFALDGCDREALAAVAAARNFTGEDIRQRMSQAVRHRFPEAGKMAEPLQWLSDNDGIYTALETQVHTERLGLVPVTTPARSPQ